ncbi:hypothetical protein DM02DRAFT_643005 [Periconia macrospinosa]|uniref:Xylanolytic transcriptional activator regulatory domain-containing protein n=1 Tax=Periconia macrospinosa TaxID=97972 RepID=A0A2V1DMP2_9PLEO|nr:hypothetical protein DM02DRAFT_643005 [Periconia macrospinosa]
MECGRYATQTQEIRQRYEQLSQRKTAHEELVDLLKNGTEQDANYILNRLRAGIDVTSILTQVRDGNLLMQLSLVPDTHRKYAFPYSSRIPTYLSSFKNPYFDSLVFKAAFSPSDTGSSAVLQRQPARGNKRQSVADAEEYPSAYVVPYHAAQMVEPVLEKITAESWTRVIHDNKLIRHLLRSYFCYPHASGPFVHKDLFLGDMAAGRTRFCTPLLVNALLANAAQTFPAAANRSKIWLPDSLTYRFLSEARRLWDLELLKKPRISTIQAALILSYISANNGLDKIGTVYLEQAIKMSKRLDLFGEEKYGKDTKIGKARIFTAWAVFSWQAVFDYYFFRPPHLEQPPRVPLPDSALDPQWYGEIWMQYPSDQTPIPLCLGHKLKTEASLHAIMNEMGLALFGEPSPPPLTLEEIATFKRRLEEWKRALPEPLQPHKLVFPHHINLHVQCHQVAIGLMKLIPESSSLDDPAILDICAGQTPTLAIYEASLLLETVVRLYYLRHSFDFYDPWVGFALTILGNTAIANLAAEADNGQHLDSYRSTLILSTQGLKTQSAYYHLGTLLTIQLQSAMTPEDLQLVRTYVTAAGVNDHDQRLIAEHSHSQWPLPIIGGNEDPEQVVLKNLVKAFEEVEVQSSAGSNQGDMSPPK